MGIGHNEIMIADDGDAVAAERAAMHADKLAENVIMADTEPGCFAFVFQVLGICAYRTVAEKAASFSNCRPALDGDVGVQHGACSDLCVGADHAIRAYVGLGGDFAGTVDKGCWMYGHFGIQGALSRKTHQNSPSRVRAGAAYGNIMPIAGAGSTCQGLH